MQTHISADHVSNRAVAALRRAVVTTRNRWAHWMEPCADCEAAQKADKNKTRCDACYEAWIM
jgi:hypothetical protein